MLALMLPFVAWVFESIKMNCRVNIQHPLLLDRAHIDLPLSAPLDEFYV